LYEAWQVARGETDMLTLTTLLKAMRQKAEYGELDVAVPRDHAPAFYYAEKRLRERDCKTDEVRPMIAKPSNAAGSNPVDPTILG